MDETRPPDAEPRPPVPEARPPAPDPRLAAAEPVTTPSEPDTWQRPRPPREPDELGLPEPVFTPFSLTVGDGFKFGCGFMMALTIAVLIGLLACSVVLLAASAVGVPITPAGR